MFVTREMNSNFPFSVNNSCWRVIMDQSFSDARDKQWPNFILAEAFQNSN